MVITISFSVVTFFSSSASEYTSNLLLSISFLLLNIVYSYVSKKLDVEINENEKDTCTVHFLSSFPPPSHKHTGFAS